MKERTEEAKPIFRSVVDTCLKTPSSCCLKDEKAPAVDDVHKKITWKKELQARALDKIMSYKVYGHVVLYFIVIFTVMRKDLKF